LWGTGKEGKIGWPFPWEDLHSMLPLSRQKGISLVLLLICLLVFVFYGTLRRVLFPIMNLFAGEERLERTEIRQVMAIVESRTGASKKLSKSHAVMTNARLTEAK